MSLCLASAGVIKAIERNCRTCHHARVVADGWVCSLVGMNLTPDMQRRYQELGLEAVNVTPEQFGELMQRDHAKYGRLIKAANIKVD